MISGGVVEVGERAYHPGMKKKFAIGSQRTMNYLGLLHAETCLGILKDLVDVCVPRLAVSLGDDLKTCRE